MTLPSAKAAGRLVLASIILGSSLNLADEQAAAISTEKIDVQIESRKVVGDRVIRLTEEQEVRIVWTTR